MAPYCGLMVVFFDDLQNAFLMEDGEFESVSCGDAVFTLVKKETLINELSHRDLEYYQPLIAELEKVHNECLVALNG